MRRFHTGSVRGVALAAAFCVLGGAAGCGRETFNLLEVPDAAGAFSGAAGANQGGTAGVGLGGSTGSSFDAGSAGQPSAGAAGRRNFPEGGMGGLTPCLAGPGCMAGAGGSCATSTPFCAPCLKDKDCSGDTPHCDQEKGRCYQCKFDDDCPPDEGCNFIAGRCAKRCKDQTDCDSEADHRVCRTGMRLCVSCNYSTDCGFYDNGNNNKQDVCFVTECVECTVDRDCASNYCVAGRCQKH
ncbi:MAG: hypothetical protein ABUL62_17525 [Myxococcales bacterium]